MTEIINRANAAMDDPLEYLIGKSGRGWYRPNSSGYTSFKFDAGRYSESDAIKITHPNGPDGPRDGMFHRHQDQVNDHPSSRIEELEADVERLRGVVTAIDDKVSWEINPSNYHHDDVCRLNTDWCEVGNIASAALDNTGEGE